MENYSFNEKLKETGIDALRPVKPEILQMNLGSRCNQSCKHCHVEGGPNKNDCMTWETMEHCLKILKNTSISKVDITGGAPEMNPWFRDFVKKIKELDKHVMVRCNLTIFFYDDQYHDLPDFYARNKIEVIASLPYPESGRTDKLRGNGVFDKSIRALQLLNKAGYGKADSELSLNLVYNPAGAYLPGSQKDLEGMFKEKLWQEYGIVFNQLFTITNMPISRFLDFLNRTDNYDDYMAKLVESFNPAAATNVMCKNTLSVNPEGYIFDCDFNQMLNMPVQHEKNHVSVFSHDIQNRYIALDNHCFGCTAGAGSSCGGATAE